MTKHAIAAPDLLGVSLKDMRAYHAEPNAIKRDESAARQLDALRPHSSDKAKELGLADIKRMFEELNDQE